MGVDTTSRYYLTFGGNNVCTRADFHRDIGLYVGVTGFTNGSDTPAFDTDVGFINTRVINDQSVGHHAVHDLFGGALRLTHTISDYLAAAEFHFVAVGGEVFFNFDPELCVCKAYAIAGGRAEHVGVGLTRDCFIAV